MLVFNKYFYKNKKSKLCIGGRVAVLNDMFYEYGESTSTEQEQIPSPHLYLVLFFGATSNIMFHRLANHAPIFPLGLIPFLSLFPF
jgi:hypothetical protein